MIAAVATVAVATAVDIVAAEEVAAVAIAAAAAVDEAAAVVVDAAAVVAAVAAADIAAAAIDAKAPQTNSRDQTWSRSFGGCYSTISRITRHGLPAANTPSGTSRVTTLPAPMTVREPIFTPGQMIAPPPTHTSEPISIGLPDSCFRRSSAFSGCVAV